MSWQVPKEQRNNIIDIDNEVRREFWRLRHIKVDAAKCAYVKTLGKIRERCGEELWNELKQHKQALDEAVKHCREEDEHARIIKDALASDTRKVS